MNFDEKIDFPISMNKKTQDFLRCCLAKKPEHRKNARQLLNHPFITMVDEARYVTFTSEVSKMRILKKSENKSKRRKSERTDAKSRSRDQLTYDDNGFHIKMKSQQQINEEFNFN